MDRSEVQDCSTAKTYYAIAVAVVESQRIEKRPLSLEIFRFEDLEDATNGFAVEMLLGKGSQGCVYRAVLRNGMQVAVKRPSVGRRMLDDEAAFDNEIRILSKLNNPGLVRLLGYCRDFGKEKLLVVELMHNGNLHDLLHENHEVVPWSQRVQFALQTARAICNIHSISPPLIHRDIKSSNIFIDSHGNAKLGDFGLSVWCHTNSTSTPPAGTLGYLDPEYTTPEMLSTKNDVFSFGILLLEIMSGRNAIDVNHNPPGLVDWAIPLIKAGKSLDVCEPRLELPKCASFLKQLAALAARCVRDSSSKRPEMADVVQQLQEITWRMSPSMLNGIASTMKKMSQSKHKEVQECRISSLQSMKSYKKGSQRSLKVYDENRTWPGRSLKEDVSITPSMADNQAGISADVRSQSSKINGTAVVKLRPHGKGRLFDLFENATAVTPARFV